MNPPLFFYFKGETPPPPPSPVQGPQKLQEMLPHYHIVIPESAKRSPLSQFNTFGTPGHFVGLLESVTPDAPAHHTIHAPCRIWVTTAAEPG